MKIYDAELRDDFETLARRYLVSQNLDPDKFIIDIDVIYRDKDIDKIAIKLRQKQGIKSLLLHMEVKE